MTKSFTFSFQNAEWAGNFVIRWPGSSHKNQKFLGARAGSLSEILVARGQIVGTC